MSHECFLSLHWKQALSQLGVRSGCLTWDLYTVGIWYLENGFQWKIYSRFPTGIFALSRGDHLRGYILLINHECFMLWNAQKQPLGCSIPFYCDGAFTSDVTWETIGGIT